MPLFDDDNDTSVLDKEDTAEDRDDPWSVVVFDDPVNLMQYVTLVFKRVFGYDDEKATVHMMEVHEQGKSVLWVGQRETAELYVQQLQSHLLLAALKKT